jgi:hypothetical protein
MTVGGELYLLPMLVQTTNEKEFGLWLTPSTVDIPTRSAESMEKRLEYRKKIGRNGVGAGCLSEQVEWSGLGKPIGYITKNTWPTPAARDYMNTNSMECLMQGRFVDQLANRVKMVENKWPSPKARDWKDGKTAGVSNRQSPDLGKVVGQSKTTGSLNPMWVEWLMGWPIGWTDLKPLETDKSHCVQQQPGES